MEAPAGQSENTWLKQVDQKGAFVRRATSFRGWIGNGPDAEFPAEPGRYHLYVSYACPWAHRTLLTRKLKGLEDVISYDVVDHFLDERGWTFAQSTEAATADTVNEKQTLRELYLMADASYVGSITVPVLWDKKTSTIVNNESSEIIRMLNAAFQEFARYPEVDLLPEAYQSEIDALNEWIYPSINDGVYRSGFARSQEAYDTAVTALFEALERAEDILSTRRFLTGEQLTEADIRLFPTLVRFDPVYATHFKCNRKRIVDFPHLWGYTRDIYQMPGVAETVNMEHIRRHYYESHKSVNPCGIVPHGFLPDLTLPHQRAQLA